MCDCYFQFCRALRKMTLISTLINFLCFPRFSESGKSPRFFLYVETEDRLTTVYVMLLANMNKLKHSHSPLFVSHQNDAKTNTRQE